MEDKKAEAFASGLATILTDLDKGRRSDPEMSARIGSLADSLIKKVGAANWSDLKQRLSEADRRSTIDTLAREITDSGEKGDLRTAYAMQAVATSLVGAGFSDSRVTPGVDLLDRYIAAARDFFVANAPKPN